MDYNKLCLGCFRENKSGSDVCPSCGFNEKEYNRNAVEKMCLPAGTILQGKYLIGKMLGAGGFGITYLGFQLNLDRVVAIKEFFPSSIAFRTGTTGASGRDYSIKVSREDSRELFEKTLGSFENEGKNLASINLPGVVGIHDCFRENSTAYLVMEYISGQNLKVYQKTKGGRLEEKEILELLEPVIRSMARIHELGIIHRDISPENLILNSEGKLVLVDFGAARSMAGFRDSEGKSLTVVLKQGYAPLEQYNSRGNQGPWTDVYALCATIYRLLTGKTPEEVSIRILNENIEEDTRKTLLESGASRKTADAVTAGMRILYPDRIQNMPGLWEALYGKSDDTGSEMDKEDSRQDSDRPSGITDTIKDSIKKQTVSKDPDVQREEAGMHTPVSKAGTQINKAENKKTKPLLLILLAGVIGVGSFFVYRNVESKKAAERQEIERIALEKAESEKAESERISREKAESESESEKTAREKAESERIAKEKAESEKIAKKKKESEAESERKAKEKEESEAESERKAKEKAESEAESERKAKEIAESEAESEKKAKEKAESEAKAKAEAEAAVSGLSSSAAPEWDSYNEKIEKIYAETDPVRREALMHEAEDQLMDTWAVVPIYYYNDIYMQTADIKNIYSNVFGFKYFAYATAPDNELNVNLAGEPDYLDPALNYSVDGACLAILGFSGMYAYDAEGQLVPELAEKEPEVSEDGLTYVFTLRDGLKWSDGEDLDANDIVYSWNRLYDPDTAADFSYLVDSSNIGIKADGTLDIEASEDGKTFTVHLTNPCAYFLDLCAFPAFYPVPEQAVTGADPNGYNPGAWSFEAGFVTSGPFICTQWKHNESMVYEKNPNYWNADAVSLEKINFMLSVDDTAIFNAYKDGSLQFIDTVPTDEIANVKDQDDFYTVPNLGTYYVGFNVNSELFDGMTPQQAADMRHALCLLIDRQYIVDTVGQTGQELASTFIPTGMSDGNGGEFRANDDNYTYPDAEAVGYYDAAATGANMVEEAVELLKGADFEFNEDNTLSDATPIHLTYLTNDDGALVKIAESMQQDFALIGVTMDIESKDWQVVLNERKEGQFDIAREGWLADYNDPVNMLEMWLTNSDNNDMQFGR